MKKKTEQVDFIDEVTPLKFGSSKDEWRRFDSDPLKTKWLELHWPINLYLGRVA